MKDLIVYFSRSGENYVSGNIVDLEVGNTKNMALALQKVIKGDIFEIKPVHEYAKDYTTCTKEAQLEFQQQARFQLTSYVENMDIYEKIYILYPNWWGTCPMAVFSFLEHYDWKEKQMIAFCTHEGSGFGNSLKDIENTCPNATVIKGIAVHGSKIDNVKEIIERWANECTFMND